MCHGWASYYKCAIGRFNKWSAATFCLPWLLFLASPGPACHSFTFWWDHHLEIGRRGNIITYAPVFLCLASSYLPKPTLFFTAWHLGGVKVGQSFSRKAPISRNQMVVARLNFSASCHWNSPWGFFQLDHLVIFCPRIFIVGSTEKRVHSSVH